VEPRRVKDGCCHIKWREHLLKDSSLDQVYVEYPGEIKTEKVVCQKCNVYVLFDLEDVSTWLQTLKKVKNGIR
jgi:hypothetical protein